MTGSKSLLSSEDILKIPNNKSNVYIDNSIAYEVLYFTKWTKLKMLMLIIIWLRPDLVIR